MSKEVKLVINPRSSDQNYISANFVRLKNDSLVTQLQIDLGVKILKKNAKYFSDIVGLNKNKKAVVSITFEE